MGIKEINFWSYSDTLRSLWTLPDDENTMIETCRRRQELD